MLEEISSFCFNNHATVKISEVTFFTILTLDVNIIDMSAYRK